MAVKQQFQLDQPTLRLVALDSSLSATTNSVNITPDALETKRRPPLPKIPIPPPPRSIPKIVKNQQLKAGNQTTQNFTPSKKAPLYLASHVEQQKSSPQKSRQRTQSRRRIYGILIKKRTFYRHFNAVEIYCLYLAGHLPKSTWITHTELKTKITIGRFIERYAHRIHRSSLIRRLSKSQKRMLFRRSPKISVRLSPTAMLCAFTICLNLISIALILWLKF